MNNMTKELNPLAYVMFNVVHIGYCSVICQDNEGIQIRDKDTLEEVKFMQDQVMVSHYTMYNRQTHLVSVTLQMNNGKFEKVVVTL